MRSFRTSTARPGFTIIEVMVATTIIGIIAASASLSYLKTRLNARNSQRKEVAQTYTKAVGSYAAANGTSFITTSGQKSSCTVPALVPNHAPDDATNLSTPACVGASGRSYGMLNYDGTVAAAAAAVNEYNLSTDLGVAGYTSGSASFTYGAGGSILSALKLLGYLDTVSFDPSAHPVQGKIAKDDRDYLLVRCCKDGRQAVGTGGSLFAVWAKLEPGGSADFSIADANSQHACGGPKVAPPTYGSPDGSAATVPNGNYHYLFGATGPVTGQLTGTSGHADAYDPSWFAVGNSPVLNLTSLSDSCDKNA